MLPLLIMIFHLHIFSIERYIYFFLIGSLLFVPCSIPTAFAQQNPGTETPQEGTGQGMSRIQGRVYVPEPPPAPIRSEIFLDLREEMRKFVIAIAQFSRQYRNDFRVIARGGLDLLVKRGVLDDQRTSPARTYIRSLDGLIAEGIFSSLTHPEKPPSAEKQSKIMRVVNYAKINGVRVFTFDHGKSRGFIDRTHHKAKKFGFVSLVSQKKLSEISYLPTYPKRPFDENPKNILSLGQVKNFVAITNSIPFGRQDSFALKLHSTNYDMVIVDVFHGRQPLTRRAVETLKFKKVGAKRLVIAQMNIGLAASYKYYWEDRWGEGSPSFINVPLRNDPDQYYVKYWLPRWQNLIAGDTNSYLYGIIRQGFDGVLIDGLETYKFFEDGEE